MENIEKIKDFWEDLSTIEKILFSALITSSTAGMFGYGVIAYKMTNEPQQMVQYIDIDNDGIKDKITTTRVAMPGLMGLPYSRLEVDTLYGLKSNKEIGDKNKFK